MMFVFQESFVSPLSEITDASLAEKEKMERAIGDFTETIRMCLNSILVRIQKIFCLEN